MRSTPTYEITSVKVPDLMPFRIMRGRWAYPPRLDLSLHARPSSPQDRARRFKFCDHHPAEMMRKGGVIELGNKSAHRFNRFGISRPIIIETGRIDRFDRSRDVAGHCNATDTET
jgi:hypothetical protein